MMNSRDFQEGSHNPRLIVCATTLQLPLERTIARGMKLSEARRGFCLIAAFHCRTAASAAFCPFSRSLRVTRKLNCKDPSLPRLDRKAVLAVLLAAAKDEQSESAEDGWESPNDTSIAPERTPAVVPIGGGGARDKSPDMFIPVFATVAILGFVGIYAYETARLYFAGELYVPF
jgi:hypothetical protein